MTNRKPNWSKWNLIEDALVWQVVALSLDIDPDAVTRSRNDWMAGGKFVNHEGKDFQDRLDIISANYEKIDPIPKPISLNGIAYLELNIPMFSKWAIEKNLSIPNELKQLVKQIATQQPTPAYETNLLKIQNLAIKNFYESRRRADPKKDEVTEWIKSEAAKLEITISQNIADAIFTIIKPDDHNPKIRRD